MKLFLRGAYWFCVGALTVLPLGLKDGMDKIAIWQLFLSAFGSGLAAVGAHMGYSSQEKASPAKTDEALKS